ncbi:LCP family protein [Demetria terragena]|uniref:LCP family protein n=1 Tax=Demetria terragena TaxID=63959 RepID=UPI00146145C5|nr:LCP family protein [Demetria terragena]
MTHRVRLVAGLISGAMVLAACSDAEESRESVERTAPAPTAAPESGATSGVESSPTSSGRSSSGSKGSATASSSGSASGSGSQSDSGSATPASKAGAFTPAVAKKLGRSTVPAAEMRKASTGDWKGTKVGILAQGEDTTLAVKSSKGWQIVGGWWPSKSLPGPYLGGKRHVLMLGSDARPQQSVARARADAIQIAGLDGTGGGGILGIPRDTRTARTTGGVGKVNAAMARGGPGAQTATVARMTGLPISGYLLASMDGFSATVTAMGGVEITLNRQIRHLKPGTQKLNGPDMLMVARERKTMPRGDIDRSSNQGLVMMAALTTMRSQGLAKLPPLLTKTSRHYQTNLSVAEVLTLFTTAYVINPSRVGRAVADTRPAGNDLALTAQARATFARFADGNL